MGISVEAYPELIEKVCIMVADDRYDGLVPLYLEIAMQAILERRYPMDPTKTWDDTEGRYDAKACVIATQLINRRGAEGETAHEENGVRREYASVPALMLKGIVPFVGVPR